MLSVSTPQVHTYGNQVLFRNNFALSRDIASSFKVRLVMYCYVVTHVLQELSILYQSLRPSRKSLIISVNPRDHYQGS